VRARPSPPRLLLTLLTCAALLAGCSLARRAPPPPQLRVVPGAPAPAGDPGRAIAAAASSLLGTRYEFGGADLGGFDCSGLALYVYAQSGIAIPRTAREQQRAAQPVPRAQLEPGDLVFFHISGRAVDHVGVYVGAGEFVHAPHRGVAVTVGELAGGYYAQHLVSAGRFRSGAVSSQ